MVIAGTLVVIALLAGGMLLVLRRRRPGVARPDGQHAMNSAISALNLKRNNGDGPGS